MSAQRARRAGLALALLAIVVAGAGLRAHVAARTPPHLSADERAYGRLAVSLAGHLTGYHAPYLRQPTHWAPGAPYAFALAERALDPKRPERTVTAPAARTVNAVAGTVTILLAFALAALLAGPIVGLLAALAVALYPPSIAAAGTQLSEPLGAMWLVAAFVALAWAWRRPRPVRFAAAGVLLGVCVLTRADLLGAPVLLALVLLVALGRRVGTARAGLTTLALAAGFAVVVGPWVVAASLSVGRFVPVSSGGPATLFIGTYLPGGGTLIGAKRALAGEVHRAFPSTRDVNGYHLPATKVLRTVAQREPVLSRDEALSRQARKNLRRYALGRPVAFAGMALGKTWRMWGDTFRAGRHRTPPAALRVLHLVLVALSALGLLAGLVRARHAVLWAAVAVLVYSTLDNAVLVAEPRHNVPLMPLLLAAGAAGAALAVRGRGPGRPAPVADTPPDTPPDTPDGTPERDDGAPPETEPARAPVYVAGS